MSSEFTEVRSKFGRMFFRVQNVIKKHRTPIKHHLIRFLKWSFPHLASRLCASKRIEDILSLVQKKCSLINISLLENMIEELELKEAKKHIKSYKAVINKFCQTISVRLCLNETFQVTVSHHPLKKHETITFLVEGNPDKYMLDDVRDLLSATFEKILSRSVHVVVIKEGNSFIIKCRFPVHLASQLIAKASKNLQMLKKEFGLLSLTIGYDTVWNKQNKDIEVNRI